MRRMFKRFQPVVIQLRGGIDPRNRGRRRQQVSLLVHILSYPQDGRVFRCRPARQLRQAARLIHIIIVCDNQPGRCGEMQQEVAFVGNVAAAGVYGDGVVLWFMELVCVVWWCCVDVVGCSCFF